jgi:hypothetical protein
MLTPPAAYRAAQIGNPNAKIAVPKSEIRMPKLRQLVHLKRDGGYPGRGRIQRAAKRAAIGRRDILTADVTAIAYARKRLLNGRKLVPRDYDLARKGNCPARC